MGSSDRILVYHYRHNGAPAVPNGLAIITSSDLADILEKNPTLQSTRKPLPRGATTLDIHQRDLYTPAQTAAHAARPNAEANIASVRVPLEVTVRRALTGAFGEVVILSWRRGV